MGTGVIIAIVSYLGPMPSPPREPRRGGGGKGCCFRAHLEAGVRSVIRAAAIGSGVRPAHAAAEPESSRAAVDLLRTGFGGMRRPGGSGIGEPPRKGARMRVILLSVREKVPSSFFPLYIPCPDLWRELAKSGVLCCCCPSRILFSSCYAVPFRCSHLLVLTLRVV
jgi:hypothetical protein